MPTVYVRSGEHLEKALKRFNDRVSSDGVLTDYKKHTSFRPKREAKHRKGSRKRK